MWGNLSSAVLAHFMLKERLQKMGVVGCVSCVVGSVVIVIHAPQEHTPSSVQEIWTLATQTGWYSFLFFDLLFCWTNLLSWVITYWVIGFVFPSHITAFLIYVVATLSVVLALILYFEPRCGQTNILVYLGICSLMGSITVITISLS